MNKQYTSLLVLLCLFINALFANSQTVDELIQNYSEAIGGADKLMEINSIKYTGKFSGNGTDIPITITLKRDGKARMEMIYQGMSMIRACDGNVGWTVNPFNGNKEAERLPPEDVKDLEKRAELEGELINYKEKGYKAEYLGMDDFEGTEVYKIRIKDKDGDMTYYYIDASNYLLLKDNSKRKLGEKEIKSKTLYGNYQKVNGVMYPMSVEYIDGDAGSGQKLIFEKIETNVNVNDDIFKMPAIK